MCKLILLIYLLMSYSKHSLLYFFIVGRSTPFLEIQDAPTFHRFIRKTKVLNNSCNQFVYNFYPQSILVLEECLQKW